MNKHETWNTCPDCGQKWRDPEPTPGILHRTRVCAICWERYEQENTRKKESR